MKKMMTAALPPNVHTAASEHKAKNTVLTTTLQHLIVMLAMSDEKN
jgi:hypothetical protein